MTFQRIVCILLIIASALVFVYSLGMMTDMFNGIYQSYRNGPRKGDDYKGTEIYLDIQPFNKALTIIGIILILVSLFNCVMGTNSRRKYYVGNYVSIALSTICNVGVSVWAVMELARYKNDYITKIDWNNETLKNTIERRGGVFSNSTLWFDIGYVVFGILILFTVLLLVNLVMKIMVMRSEKSLIGSRKDVRA